MSERRYSALLYGAVATAILATVGVYYVLQNAKEKSRLATRPVLVAAKDIPEGTSLTANAVRINRIPVALVPTGAYNSSDLVIGRILRVPIFAGEIIVPGRLAPVGTSSGLEVKIGNGRRAMAVKIDDVAGISGLIQPNSRVDVVVTLRPDLENRDPVAKLFMENLRVLSVGTTVERDMDGKPINATTAALEVTPDEAERLAVAAKEGSIQLILRGFADLQTVTTSGARARDVLGQLNSAPAIRIISKPPNKNGRTATTRATTVAALPATPPITPPVTVTIYHGSKVDQQMFNKPDTRTP